jgi:hypothetical protein
LGDLTANGVETLSVRNSIFAVADRDQSQDIDFAEFQVKQAPGIQFPAKTKKAYPTVIISLGRQPTSNL